MCGTHARCQGTVAGVGSGAGRLAPPPPRDWEELQGQKKSGERRGRWLG